MRNITYKYNIGDTVYIKMAFAAPTTGLADLAGVKAKVVGRRDYNGPCYQLEGLTGYFQESTIFGTTDPRTVMDAPKTSGASVVLHAEQEVTEDEFGASEDASESKWYRISFSAKLGPDDIRAMKKCFFDAMNESMEIYDLANLVIEEA